MQPFSVGTCLGDAFDALKRSWLALVVVLALAMPALQAALRVLAHPHLLTKYRYMLLLIPGYELLIGTLVTAAALGALYRRQLSFGRVLVASLRRLVPVYFVIVLVTLVVAAIGFGCSLPYASRTAWDGGLPAGALAMFGLWMLVAALLYTRWFVAVPAAVLETWNPLRALRRSDRLTRGHRGALFSIVALIGTLAGGTMVVLEVRLGDRPDIDAILFAVALLGSIPLIVVRAAISATAYAQLRAAIEAGDPERLGEVFA